MSDIRPSAPKAQFQLTLEWEQLAEERHRQIASGEDLSFEHILVPVTLMLFEGAENTRVIDVGSGTGDLTARIATIAKEVIGIDPSHRNVELAKSTCARLGNVKFINATIEQSVDMLQQKSATAALASMTLTAVPDLTGFAGALARILSDGAKFIATIPHPWFWPRYWGYEDEAWFSYKTEMFIEAPFVISNRLTAIRTTHVHRPLEQYVRAFEQAGFLLDRLAEPMPSPEIERLYPKPWRFPRFLALRWVKTFRASAEE